MASSRALNCCERRRYLSSPSRRSCSISLLSAMYRTTARTSGFPPISTGLSTTCTSTGNPSVRRCRHPNDWGVPPSAARILSIASDRELTPHGCSVGEKSRRLRFRRSFRLAAYMCSAIGLTSTNRSPSRSNMASLAFSKMVRNFRSAAASNSSALRFSSSAPLFSSAALRAGPILAGRSLSTYPSAPAFMHSTAVSSFMASVITINGIMESCSFASLRACGPGKVGRLQPETITSGRKSLSAARKPTRVATRVETKSKPARRSSFSISPASDGKSSLIRMRNLSTLPLSI